MTFRDVLLWHQAGSFKRSAGYAVAVVLVSLVLARSTWSIDSAFLTDGHAIVSLDLAIARAYCGYPSAYSTTIRIPGYLGTHMDRREVPLRTLVVEKAGSIAAYCQAVDTPFVNSENSLMLLETAILKARPGISLAGLGEALYLIKVACLAAFMLLLVDLGSSLALALATLLCGLMLLQSMPDYVYSNYPFIFVLVLGIATFHTFAIKYRWTARAPGLLIYGVVAGLLSAFIVNMRTSYLPTVGLMFACVLIDEWRARQRALPWRARSLRAAALAGCFVAGYFAFQTGLITRYLPEETRFNAAHPFAHPLVLALGVPDNAFSRSVGIRWADEVGPKLAEAVDPGVPFLGPRYNAALLKVYGNLWRAHPREMLDLYYMKFSVAGADMIRVLRGSPGLAGFGVNLLLTPLALLPSGVWMLLLYAIASAAALAWYWLHDSPAAFALALLSGAAFLLQVECGVIFSIFVKQYHNYAAFYALFISLLAVQAIGNWAWTRVVAPRFPQAHAA